MFALLSAFLFLIAFILHWAGKGTVPWDTTGFTILGLLALAVHFTLAVPWWPARRPPP